MGDPISLGIMAASAVVGAIGQRNQLSSAIKAQNMATYMRVEQLKSQQNREKTQAAMEAAERSRKLTRTLARQRAIFAGAGIEGETGTAVTLGNESKAVSAREQKGADLMSLIRIGNVGMKIGQTKIAGQSAVRGFKSQKRNVLVNLAGDLAGIASKKKGG